PGVLLGLRTLLSGVAKMSRRARRPQFLRQPPLECGVEKVPWQQSRGEGRRGEERVELILVPARVAGGEHDLDEDLLAPFAHLAFDGCAGAGDAMVAPAPMGDQIADRSKVGVDCQLVPAGVIAGSLVFEIAGRA